MGDSIRAKQSASQSKLNHGLQTKTSQLCDVLFSSLGWEAAENSDLVLSAAPALRFSPVCWPFRARGP